MLLSLLTGLLHIAASFVPVATAQIDNNQPSQPFAAIVPCIRAGQNINPVNSAYISPRFATTCYASRLHDGGYNAPGGDADNGDALASDTALVEFGDAQPDDSADLFGVPANGHTTLATVGEVGSVYGLAYASGTNPTAPSLARTQRLFASAYHKRLTRFGAGGPGGIYLTSRALGSTSLYVSIPNVVPGPVGAAYNAGDGARARFPNDPAGNNPYSPEMGGLHRAGDDAQEQGYVGAAGLGDLALDPQERYLYVVNLNDRLVYRVDSWSSTPQATLTTLPVPSIYASLSSCNASGASGPQDLHPFGLAVSASALYLGFVCSAERSQDRADLSAGVLRYDLAGGSWSLVFATRLASYDAERGSVPGYTLAFNPWRTNGGATYHYPQPILSGLAFDEAGDLILGLRDRYADLSANGRAVGGETQGAGQGDLLIATPNGSGGWSVPSGSGSEYFADGDDQGSATAYPGDWLHGESSWGGIAYVPGAHDGGYGGEVASTVISPYRVNAGGVAWWDATGGAATAREELYQTSTQMPNTFQKAAGLGDLELLCAWRALGDRVWRDTNGNGVQDGGEPDLSGVRVQLLDASGTVVATVTSGSLAGMHGNYRFYVDPFASYSVRIDPAMFAPGQPLADLSLTLPNVGANDARDSDADAGGRIAVAAAGNRDVNETFDIGLVASANVRISKSGPATALPTQTIAYTLAYANDGPAAAQQVTVVDTLPAGLRYLSAAPAPASVAGQVISWNLGTLAAGASGTLLVNVVIDSTATGSLTNRAQISTTTPGDDPDDNTSTVSTTVQRPNVRISKSGPATALPTQTLAYTLAYTNDGPATAQQLTVVDTLPSGLRYLSATPAPASVVGQVISWNLGTLAAGASGAILVSVAVDSTATGSLTNRAQISTTTPGDDPDDNTSTVSTTVQRPNVRISKTGPPTMIVGDVLTYTLAYANDGTAAAQQVIVVDTLPGGITFVRASPAPTSIVGQVISWNLGTLAAGASGTILVSALSDSSAAGSLTNRAQISTTTPGDDPGDNTSTVSTIVQRPNVWVQKTGPATILVSDVLSYTLTYANDGSAGAAAVQVVDTLPSGLSYRSATPAPSVVSGQVLTWNLGTLAVGAQGRISVVVQSSSSLASGTALTNTAQITTTTPGDDPSDNTSTATTTALAPDLSIRKSDGVALVQPGDLLTYTLTIHNSGPITATNVLLTELPPLPIVDPAWTVQGDGSYTQLIGALGPGATITRSVTIQLPNPLPLALQSQIANVARVRTPCCADPTPEDTTSTDTDTPIAGRVGDLIWLDRDGDGVADADEPGLAHVPLELLDPLTGTVLVTTTTDERGGYTFAGLRLGRYVVRISPSALDTIYYAYAITTAPAPAATLSVSAPSDTTLDIGLRPRSTTAVVLAYLLVEPAVPQGLSIRWGTLAEQATDHFRVERTTQRTRSGAVLVGTLDSQGSQGGDYRLTDLSAPSGPVYYWLIEVETSGQEHSYGPAASVQPTAHVTLYLPLVTR